MADVKSAKVKPDWSRLLGFDQAVEARETATSKINEPSLSKAGAKFGAKIGNKPGVKTAPR
jgi:hypothetical protein